MAEKKLSICIATFNRGMFIGDTLDSILALMEPDVELVIVDGASSDNTPEVILQYLALHPELRYYREPENSGIDRDYDKAVGYAVGEYCWLMTDDDLLRPGAIQRVLSAIDEGHDLVVMNAEVMSVDFAQRLAVRLPDNIEERYGTGDKELFFTRTAKYLSFIGAIIIRRHLWLARDRVTYYGTLFIHVGVVFQHPPIETIKVIAEPLIMIRLGNAMWTARGFEIWMFKWPQLIWSFPDFSNDAKEAISPREPWRQVMRLVFYRAIGGYDITAYHQYLKDRVTGLSHVKFLAIAIFPAKVANFISVIYCLFKGASSRMALYDLSRSKHASWASRFVLRYFKLGER